MGNEVRRSYDAVADGYAAAVGGELDHRPLERAVLAALSELADLDAEPGVIADLGAGPGHVAGYVAGIGMSTIAVDLSPRMAAIALHRHGVPSAAGSLTALPLASSALAGALVLFAWIHLTDDELAVAAAELRRVLRPGGVAVVSFHVGDDVIHLDEWHGQVVDLDFRLLRSPAVTALLDDAGLPVEATLERAATPMTRHRHAAATSSHAGRVDPGDPGHREVGVIPDALRTRGRRFSSSAEHRASHWAVRGTSVQRR